jgi:hypothetical protein
MRLAEIAFLPGCAGWACPAVPSSIAASAATKNIQ